MDHKMIAAIRYFLLVFALVLLFTTRLPPSTVQAQLLPAHPSVSNDTGSTKSYLPFVVRPAPTGPDWTITTVDDAHPMSNMGDHSLRLTADDLPRIAYGSNHLFYAHLEETGWVNDLVDASSGVGKYASLALDSNGSPYISYNDATNKDLKYAHWTGSNWDVQTLDYGSTSYFGTFTSIVVDSNNNPGISYLGYDYNYTLSKYVYDLNYTHLNNTYWNDLILDSSENISGFISMGLDPDNHPHISYYDDATNKNLKYVQYTGSTWFQITFDLPDDTGKYSSLAVDEDSNTYISYLDDSNDRLKMVSFRNSDMNTEIEIVDPNTSVSQNTSIALDSHGRPHIAYYDKSKKDLKYARWTGTTWVITTIDSTGDVGKYASLALDSHDLAHISYYDSTHASLKYAVQNYLIP